MKELKNLLSTFTPAKKENFPEKECVIPTGEQGVYESSNWYWCALFLKDFPEDGIRFVRLKPYIWRGSDFLSCKEVTLYAWITGQRNEYFDNYENSIHDDDAVVIAFKKDENQNDECDCTKFVEEYLK